MIMLIKRIVLPINNNIIIGTIIIIFLVEWDNINRNGSLFS